MARTTEEVMVTLQDLGCREITESQANVANDNLLGEERILAAFSGIEPRGDSVKIKIPFIATQYRILILASEIEEGWRTTREHDPIVRAISWKNVGSITVNSQRIHISHAHYTNPG